MTNLIFDFPALQAHRGYHVTKIENTMDALEAAKQNKFLACEFDVRLSQDGIPVLHHDRSMKRIYGNPRMIHMTNWSELKKTGVCSLEDVFHSNRVPDFLNVEIKNESLNDFHLEDKILQLVRQVKSNKQILISSFNPLSLMFFQHRLPALPRALIVNLRRHVQNPIYLRRMWLDPLLSTQFLHIDYHSCDRRILFLNKLRGRRVSVWTVNDTVTTKGFLDAGIASVISDTVTPTMLKG
ncbi:MAG: glycerophosphodiester phosphodiesterase [Pseudobdellovibrionaceae bacterium]